MSRSASRAGIGAEHRVALLEADVDVIEERHARDLAALRAEMSQAVESARQDRNAMRATAAADHEALKSTLMKLLWTVITFMFTLTATAISLLMSGVIQ